MDILDEIDEMLIADADATSDLAKAAAYRLRARQVEELRLYYRVRHNPADSAAKLPGFWDAPGGAQESHHTVTFHWDKAGLTAMEIARTDGEPLLPSDLRDASIFPFRELIRRDREAVAGHARVFDMAASLHDHLGDTHYAEEAKAIAEDLREAIESPRSPRLPQHWKEVARIYSEATANHDPRPVVRVAEEFNVARSTASNWIYHCRKNGYLLPTEERKAKGNPI